MYFPVLSCRYGVRAPKKCLRVLSPLQVERVLVLASRRLVYKDRTTSAQKDRASTARRRCSRRRSKTRSAAEVLSARESATAMTDEHRVVEKRPLHTPPPASKPERPPSARKRRGKGVAAAIAAAAPPAAASQPTDHHSSVEHTTTAIQAQHPPPHRQLEQHILCCRPTPGPERATSLLVTTRSRVRSGSISTSPSPRRSGRRASTSW